MDPVHSPIACNGATWGGLGQGRGDGGACVPPLCAGHPFADGPGVGVVIPTPALRAGSASGRQVSGYRSARGSHLVRPGNASAHAVSRLASIRRDAA